MAKRPRPNSHHRAICEFIERLPVGKHLIDVRAATLVKFKPEGGLIWDHEDNTITVIPDGLGGFKRVTRA